MKSLDTGEAEARRGKRLGSSVALISIAVLVLGLSGLISCAGPGSKEEPTPTVDEPEAPGETPAGPEMPGPEEEDYSLVFESGGEFTALTRDGEPMPFEALDPGLVGRVLENIELQDHTTVSIWTKEHLSGDRAGTCCRVIWTPYGPRWYPWPCLGESQPEQYELVFDREDDFIGLRVGGQFLEYEEVRLPWTDITVQERIEFSISRGLNAEGASGSVCWKLICGPWGCRWYPVPC